MGRADPQQEDRDSFGPTHGQRLAHAAKQSRLDRLQPRADIPFKVGSTGEGPALWRKMWGLFVYKQAEWAAAYHARSQVETVFSMVKAKFGANVLAKSLTAQKNEVLAKILAHNICRLVHCLHEFGVAAEFGTTQTGGGHVH